MRRVTFPRKSPGGGGDPNQPAKLPRSRFGTATFVLTSVSAVAWVVTMVNLATIGDGEFGPIAGTFFSLFILSWLFTTVAGVITWVAGSRRGRGGDVRAGQLAIGYVVIAFLVFVFVVYHGGTN